MAETNFVTNKLDNLSADDSAPTPNEQNEQPEQEAPEDAPQTQENAFRREEWAKYGWKVSPQSVFSVNYDNLEVILDAIGNQMKKQEFEIHHPPWLEAFQETVTKTNSVDGQLVEMKTELAKLRSEMSGRTVANDEDEPPKGSDSDSDSDSDEDENAQNADGSVDLAPLRKEIKHLKLDLSNMAIALEGIKTEAESVGNKTKLDVQSKLSAMQLNLEQLRLSLSTVASTQDWKQTQEMFSGQIEDLKRQLAAQTLSTERKMDDRLGKDLKKASNWRDDVESSFNEQLKMMDDRVAIIQDDMYAIRTGHGLEVNELEDRFEEHLKNCERTFNNVQNDLRRLLKRSNDANDKLESLAAHNARQDEKIGTLFEQHEEHRKTQEEMYNTHQKLLDELDDRMKDRVDDHERVLLVLEDYQKKFVEVSVQHEAVLADIKSHDTQLEACREEEASIKEELKAVQENSIPDLQLALKELTEKQVKDNEGAVKNLTRLKDNIEKAYTSISNSQKEVNAFNGRLETAETAINDLRPELAAITTSIDIVSNELKNEIHAVDVKTNEIAALKNIQGSQAERLFNVERSVEDHNTRLKDQKDAGKQGSEKLDGMHAKLDQTIADLDAALRAELKQSGASLADLQREGEHRDKAIFNLGNVVAENERRAEMHRHPASEVMIWLEELVQLCVEFEKETIPEKPPQISHEMAQSLSRRAQSLAGYFASQADFEAIRKLLVQSTPEEENYEDDMIDILRHEMTQDFLGGLFTEIKAVNNTPSQAMLEARKKFKTKLRLAIETALSKFEAVEVVSNSRLQAVALKPRCVACDRPLNNKRKVNNGASSYSGPIVGRPDTAPAPNAANRTGRSSSNYNGGDTRPIMVPGGSNFVYRGGFRITKSQSFGEMPEKASLPHI